MQQHCNIQNNITMQHNKTQNNSMTNKQYWNSTKQHNKTHHIIITYKSVVNTTHHNTI